MEDYSGILTPSQEYELYNDATVRMVQDALHNGSSLLNGALFDREESYLISDNQYLKEENIFDLVPNTPTTMVLSTEDFAGDLNFEAVMNPHESKNSWIYSAALRKIFIPVHTTFPVDFKCDPSNTELFIRATPAFILSQHSLDPVMRCIAHAQQNDLMNKGHSEHIWDHVIRCENAGAVYQGDKNQGQRLSVVIPLGNPQAGSNTIRFMYKFMCKNSCPAGMNRRPVEVIFTLENLNGEILGRAKVGIRVCSCPKRDKDKEEECLKKGDDNPPPGKRRKNEKTESKRLNTEDMKFYSSNVGVYGKNNMIAVYTFAQGLMAKEAMQQGRTQPFKSCFEDLGNNIKNLQDSKE